jgi:hypothetical protein
MNEKAEFAVSASQTADLFQFDKNQASRTVKAILGEGFQFDKWKSELHPKAVNVLTLDQFNTVMIKLAFSGNQAAQELMLDLNGMALHQLFSDAFNERFDKEDRQNYLKARQIGKVTRRTLTDAIKDYISKNDIQGNRAKFLYKNASDALNRGLFGHAAKDLVAHFECEKDNLRDQFDAFQLTAIERVEDIAIGHIDEDNMDPVMAIKAGLVLGNRGRNKMAHIKI